MKTKSIKAVGHCGLTIELNLMDQYELTHLVERLEWHKHQKEVFETWKKERSTVSWDKRKEWDASHLEPESPVFPEEEMDKAYIFLRKLTLGGISKATVFDEEPVEKECEDWFLKGNTISL